LRAAVRQLLTGGKIDIGRNRHRKASASNCASRLSPSAVDMGQGATVLVFAFFPGTSPTRPSLAATNACRRRLAATAKGSLGRPFLRFPAH
jgi:hypothetical protein